MNRYYVKYPKGMNRYYVEYQLGDNPDLKTIFVFASSESSVHDILDDYRIILIEQSDHPKIDYWGTEARK